MYVFERTQFPLCISLVSGTVTDVDTRRMADAIDWMGRQTAPYLTLSLTHDIARIDSALRKRIAELAGRNKGDDCLASAIVVDSAIVAGALRAIRWLTPAPHVERHFSDAGTAVAWLAELGRTRGAILTPATCAAALALDHHLRSPSASMRSAT